MCAGTQISTPTGSGPADPPLRVAYVAAVVAPLVVGVAVVVGLLGERWTPVGDWAAMWFRTRDVASLEPPLVGVYSTRGWNHPGPAPFWFLWLVARLSFGSPSRAFAVTAAINALTLSLLVVAVRRWTNTADAVVTGLLGAVIAHALGGERLGDFWNPYPPTVWFFVFVVSSVCAWESRRTAPLLTALVFGSLAAHAHLAFFTLVVPIAGITALALWSERDAGLRRRQWQALGGTLAVLWIAPALDLAFGSRNAVRVTEYFLDADGERIGASAGAGLVAREFAPWGPLLRGSQPHALGGVAPAPTWWLASVVVGLALLTVAVGVQRWDAVPHRSARYSLTVAVVLCGSSLLLAGGLEGYVFDYLVTFLVAAAASFWWIVTRGLLQPLLLHPRSARRRGRATASTLMLIAILAVAANAVATDPSRARLPAQEWAAPSAAAVDALDAHIADTRRPVLVDYLEDEIGIVAPGVIGGLLDRGQPIVTYDGTDTRKWGATVNVATRGRARGVVQRFTVVVTYRGNDATDTNQCVVDHAGAPIVDVQLLSPAQRRELDALRVENYLTEGRLAPSSAERFELLAARATRVRVFEGEYRRPCAP